jgi:threonine dehydrogenase-like Zn-dependent dehydrogenase
MARLPSPGTRVVGILPSGAWAERVNCRTHAIAALPDQVGDAEAATLPVAGLTALHSLRQGGFLLGRKVLVDGASGGVGHLACQLATAAGAQVWGHVRRGEHHAAVAVALLTKDFLDRLQSKLETSDRMTLEQFIDNIRIYEDHKQDGDWLRRISDAKSALISVQGYPAFNKAILAFRFFAERAETRPHHREQALRGAYLTAALACIALDSALERVVYEDQRSRYQAIADGVTYGDGGDARVQSSIKRVLELIATGLPNGRVVSRQANDLLEKMFESVRADIIAEHFTKEHNAATLVGVAKELDNRAHSLDPTKIQTLSVDAKSVLGVLPISFTRSEQHC